MQEHLHVCGSCTNKCFLRSEQGPQGLQKAKGKTSKLERQQRERKKSMQHPRPRQQLHPTQLTGPTPFHALEGSDATAEDKRERRKEAALARKPARRKRRTFTGRMQGQGCCKGQRCPTGTSASLGPQGPNGYHPRKSTPSLSTCWGWQLGPPPPCVKAHAQAPPPKWGLKQGVTAG